MVPTERNAAIRTLATMEENASNSFQGKNLLMLDVLRGHARRTGQPVLKGVTFKNCQIEGPAILLPINGCHFDDCNFNAPDGDMRNLVLFPASQSKVTGAIAMTDCTFIAVDFFGIGFTGVKGFLDNLLGTQSLGQVR
jgi:hypothetical protein